MPASGRALPFALSLPFTLQAAHSLMVVVLSVSPSSALPSGLGFWRLKVGRNLYFLEGLNFMLE